MKDRRSLMVVALLSLTACATTDEVDALKANLNATINSNRRVLESRISQLEDVKRKWEEQQAQLANLIRAQEDAVTKVSNLERDYSRAFNTQQDSINRLADQVRTTAHETSELRGAIEGEQGTIAKILDAEEAFHREGLRSVQQIRSELSVRGKTGRGSASLFPLDTLPR